MEMENPRRPFDRSREPGLVKKPRLTEDPAQPFTQRSAGATPRYSSASRDSDGEERGGGGYQPQQPHQELVSQYKRALAELTFNSKPIITNLTIIAGENVLAAKAVVGTICANILEVPSDQKLPSLYLLDSIVKNIASDYIKYFAARLPEVFCKAYRQVDAPIHSSMRHLFGTWKGVFPAMTLQMIEKELGFTPVANGSSSVATMSRPDSQSQRPPHSIHVNPKYLERQRLQQTSTAKGLSDMTGAMASSTVEVERPDRVSSTSASKPWEDPPVKMQHSHRDALSESIHRKNIGGAYGDFDCGSELSRNSTLGSVRTTGRVGDQGHQKQWYGSGSKITETIAGQRNGLVMKQGVPNYAAPKSLNAEHLLKSQNIGKRSSSSLSSWKNSEEEEFMWDMHSKSSHHNATNISKKSRKGHWAVDGPEKLELDNHLRKPLGIPEVSSTFDTEASSESILDGFPACSSSLIRTGGRPPVGSSVLDSPASGSTGTLAPQRCQSARAGSPSGTVHQHSPSPSVPAHHLRQSLKNFAERDPRAQPLSQSDLKTSSSPGLASTGPRDLNGSSPATTSFQLNRQSQRPLLPQMSNSGTPSPKETVSDRSNPLDGDVAGQSSTSTLLAAVLKSGVLNSSTANGLANRDLQEVGQMPLQSDIQPPLPCRTSPSLLTSSGPRVGSGSRSGPLSQEAPLATTSSSKIKVDQPPLPLGPPPSSLANNVSPQTSSVESKTSNPISNLLSSLVAKGLISASKTESPSLMAPQIASQKQNQDPGISSCSPAAVSSVPCSSTIPKSFNVNKVSEPATESSSCLDESNKMEIENLIGLNFKPNVIRQFHQPVISRLYDNFSHMCSICGLRLELQEQLDRHLEWHMLKNPALDGVEKMSRRWYANSDDWLAGKAGLPLGLEAISYIEDSRKTIDESDPMVPADDYQSACVLCGELFEDYYSEAKGVWMFKGAVYMTISSEDGEVGTTNESSPWGPIVHKNCMSENSVRDLEVVHQVKVENDA